MSDCKILHIGYNDAIRNAERTVRSGPLLVMDHPALEQELNRYLQAGYHIVNTFHSDGMWVILERQDARRDR